MRVNALQIAALSLACILSAPAAAEEVTETQKILVLISIVENLGNARFMKGENSLTCEQAAKWMREDPALHGKEHASAEAFIERVSGPDTSPYWIAMQGRRLIVREFLRQKLEGIDSKPPGAE